MQKKILITFLFKEGAGPVFTLEMARGLAQNGCEVHALLSSKISNKKDWENEKAFKSITFIETGTRKTAVQATIDFFLIKRHTLTRKFQNQTFDYIISTFYHPWSTTIFKCFKATKKIVICHDPIHHSGVGLLERWLTTHYIKAASDIIVLTQSFIPIVEKRFGYSKEHIHYMPHGRMSIYKQSTITPLTDCKNINFLFFGRIEEYKGLFILAEAYKKLTQSYSNISLTVAGSGDFSKYHAIFKELPQVKIINRYIADTEIDDYFSVPNTILVLPYLDASQSGVIPIALEYGVPIIASNTGGLKEQMDNGNLGLFSTPGDADSLMKQMEYFLIHPDFYINTGLHVSHIPVYS
jgi:glycosyltransferase involved in cell wall biosynthesis